MPKPWAAGAEVRIIGQIHGQTTNNILRFATNDQINDDNSDQLLLDLATAVLQCIVTTLLPAVSSDWTFRQLAYRRIGQINGPTKFLGAPANSVGQLGPASHSFAASLINISAVTMTRNGRGRWFLPPPGEAQVTASVIDGPTIALLAAFVACLAGKFVGPGKTSVWEIGVLSRKLAGNTNQTFDDGFFPVNSMIPNPNAAVMRSRRIGHGS